MGGDTSQASEVLDDQGHKTGQILDRQAVHDQELWHETVNVWIVNKASQVLLHLRGSKVDLGAGLWDVAIGTHLRPAEDPGDGAVRCLQAELGLTITRDQLRHLFNIQSANLVESGKLHRTLSHVFLLKCEIPATDFVFDRGKIGQLAWKPLNDIMAEVGGSATAASYLPRAGDYYSKLFEAMQAEM